jgi:transposase
VACVRVMSGATVERTCRTFGTTTVELGELRDWLDGNGCTEVAMEATGVYWKPVWNILSDGRFDLILANAAHIKAVPGRKTDINDAMWIADLVACGLIRPSYVPAERQAELRSLCAPASSCAASRRALCSASRRRWRRPTSTPDLIRGTSWG